MRKGLGRRVFSKTTGAITAIMPALVRFPQTFQRQFGENRNWTLGAAIINEEDAARIIPCLTVRYGTEN